MEQISETIKKILKTIIYFIMNLFLTFISPLWSTIKQAAALVVPKILCWDRLITAARCRYGTQNGTAFHSETTNLRIKWQRTPRTLTDVGT